MNVLEYDIREKRCRQANKVISIIASYGRKFFYHPSLGRISRLEVDSRCRIWLYDCYSFKKIYTHYRGRWKGFSSGGTMKDLILALCDYIKTGQPISPYHFGPWPDWICGGDKWGYGDDMLTVREEVMKTGVVEIL